MMACNFIVAIIHIFQYENIDVSIRHNYSRKIQLENIAGIHLNILVTHEGMVAVLKTSIDKQITGHSRAIMKY